MTISLRRTILAASIAVFSAASAYAADVKPVTKTDIAIPDIAYKKFVLKNGLTLLVHEDHKTPVVAINTWYHVGSKNEKPGKTGFAHLFEHLMFSGSDNFNQTYLNALQRIGATDLNGTTNPDRTNYFQNVPTSTPPAWPTSPSGSRPTTVRITPRWSCRATSRPKKP